MSIFLIHFPLELRGRLIQRIMWHPDTRRRWFVKPRKTAAACPYSKLEWSTRIYILESAHAAHQSGRRHPGKPKGSFALSLLISIWSERASHSVRADGNKNQQERIAPYRCAARPPNKCVFPFPKNTNRTHKRWLEAAAVTQRRPSKRRTRDLRRCKCARGGRRHLCVRELIGSTRHNITHTPVGLFCWWPGRAHKLCIFLRDTCAPINIYPHLVEYIKIGALKYISMLSSGSDALCPDNAADFDERHPVRCGSRRYNQESAARWIICYIFGVTSRARSRPASESASAIRAFDFASHVFALRIIAIILTSGGECFFLYIFSCKVFNIYIRLNKCVNGQL